MRSATGGLVVVGASAGGVEALSTLAAGLPPDLPFAVAVALHMPAAAPSVLAKIVDRSGPLPAGPAVHGARVEPGRIYVAVPDHHLLVEGGHLVLSEGPTENGHRPAINALFRSAALAYGPRAIGLLMSGVLDDGVRGLAAIRSRGGTTIVQRPDEALFSGMPRSAIQAGVADREAAAAEIGALLVRLADRETEERDMERDTNMELENHIAMGARFSTDFDTEALGPPSGFICPDCSGSLQTTGEGSFRCRVGHAWTADALLSARDEEVDRAVSVALRSLQEKSKLARKMADNLGEGVLYERYTELAEEAEHAVKVLGTRLAEAYDETEQRGVS